MIFKDMDVVHTWFLATSLWKCITKEFQNVVASRLLGDKGRPDLTQIIRCTTTRGKLNQQPPMHQLAVLSTGWGVFFHLALDGVHHNPFLFVVDHCTFSFFLVLVRFSPRPDLAPCSLSYFLSAAPTFVPNLLSPTDIVAPITSHVIDLVT